MIAYLETKDRFSKLGPLHGVWNSRIETPLCQPNHLSPDSYAPFVQELNSVLVPFPEFPQDVRLWYSDIIEGQHARPGGCDSQFFLRSVDSEARGVPFHYEARDALITLQRRQVYGCNGKDDCSYRRRVGVCHDQEYSRQIRIRNPHFGAVDDVITAIFFRGGFQTEGV